MKYPNWNEYDKSKKWKAVEDEVNLETNNGTTKADLTNMVKFLAYEASHLQAAVYKAEAENARLRKVEEVGEIMWGDAICHRCESQVCRGCSAHDFKKSLSEYLDWREGQELDKEGER